LFPLKYYKGKQVCSTALAYLELNYGSQYCIDFF